jgi:magnesium transporter
MTTPERSRRSELLTATLRRFVHRGARANISKLLGKTRPEDVALAFRAMTPDAQMSVFNVLMEDYPDRAAEVLSEVDTPELQGLVEDLSERQVAAVFERMSVDDAVAMVESLPPELEEKILEIVDVRNLAEVQTHLTYRDDSAGRLMVPAYLALNAETTVQEAIGTIRSSEDVDNVFYLYVVDLDNHLVGVASLRQLLLSTPDTVLADVMTRSVIKVDTSTDQEEVAKLAARYDLLAIPVTDDMNRLLGIVTLDDIIDVVKEEATEDIFKMVGTSDDELVYEDRSFKVAGFRLPWLLVNLVGLIGAGMLLKYFEVTLKEALVLVFFLPVVMGMGGNVGSQTSTIAVRGLATGRIGRGRLELRRFVWQQLKVGAILAVACSMVVAIGALALEENPSYALIVGASLLLVIVLAAVNGACIPLVFQKLGIDPAVASGPLVTTSNDITGILIYFGIAYLLIDLILH